MRRGVSLFSSVKPPSLGASGALGAVAAVAAATALSLGVLGAGCAPGAVYTPDIQRAFARDGMRIAETDHLILYYPAHRRAEVERFARRADACAAVLKQRALRHGDAWAEKMTLALPEAAFNNAYVSPKFLGSPDVSVIPTYNSVDFSSEYGLPPDPGFIACHELVHYVQFQQIAGLWGTLNWLGGDLYTPQIGFDPWFFEGLATYYEASLQPGAGRPVWPVFTGMFAAAFAGHSVSGSDLAAQGRKAPVGHQYLVGSMFVRFLVERYGELPLWQTIASQAHGWLGLTSAGSFRDGFGKSLGALLGEFDQWQRAQFPVRQRPADQRRLQQLGNDARYGRGRDGSEAWIADDLDLPTRLIVRGPGGDVRAEVSLVELVPPRRLVMASPLLVSGLSLTDDGREVWFTAVDFGSVEQTTRLLRWRQGEGLQVVASGLGPGVAIDGGGGSYYFSEVDGDRWSLAVYDTKTGARRTLLEASPGTYVLGGQVSTDSKTLAVSAWNGAAFVVWLIDAQRGQLLRELTGAGPLYDPAFLDDGRLMTLANVSGRFQIEVRDHDGAAPRLISDAPYAVLAPRASGSTIRFLNREGWSWTLDELPVPPPAPPVQEPAPIDPETGQPAAPVSTTATAAGAAPVPTTAAAPGASLAATSTNSAAVATLAPAAAPTAPLAPPPPAPPPSLLRDDRAYSAWHHFFSPSFRAPLTLTVVDGDPHLGFSIGGSDVLGMHRWLLTGLVQTTQDGDEDITGEDAGPYLGAIAAYANNMLAPWAFAVEASAVHGLDRVTESQPGLDDVEHLRDRKTRDLTVAFGRTWRQSWSAVAAFTGTDDRILKLPNPGEPVFDLERRKLGGPALSLSYFGGEGTAYTGARRALAVSVDAAHFPERLSSLERAVTSARAGLGLVAPLPFTRRHILTLDAFARGAFTASGPGEDLIELGGTSPFSSLWEHSNKDEPADPSFPTPDHLRLIEPLRGYEDTTFAVSRVAAAELSWRYPLIIDRGLASLWILPSTFVRQLDLELFAAGAFTEAKSGDTASHLATGAALTLRFDLFRVPLALRYQLARRLRDDRALLQLVGLAAAL